MFKFVALLNFAALLTLSSYTSAAVPSQIQGHLLSSGNVISLETKFSEKKALVLIFMSAKCPCSNSHVPEIKALASKYPDFRFAVIHSNPDESKEDAQKYFNESGLNVEIIQDEKTEIADSLKAFKTPHAFVIGPNGETLYQGGVTNSAHAPNADKHFLANALEDIQKGQKVQTPEGRTLGCVIMRENEKTIW